MLCNFVGGMDGVAKKAVTLQVGSYPTIVILKTSTAMKRLFLAFILLAVSAAVVWANDGAQATFKTRVHDFGIIKEEGGPVSVEFEFTNTGNKPLLIVDATASCGCTRPEYPTKPIKPGKKGKIKVTYSPLGRPGAFRKTVKVRTNASDQRVSLIIEGTVQPSKRK